MQIQKNHEVIVTDQPALQKAQSWILERLPVFVYVEDYPELIGHQDIAEYLARKAANPSQLTKGDHNFEKMCKVAGLDPRQLHNLHAANDHETRNQLTTYKTCDLPYRDGSTVIDRAIVRNAEPR